MQPAEEFSTLTHEIAHEMLHRGDRRTLTTKQVRETEAEAVAFVVCQALGLDTGTASADYIQLWHGDADLLRESLEVVQRTSTVILGAISPKDAVGTQRQRRCCNENRRHDLGACRSSSGWISHPNRERAVDDSGHRRHAGTWSERPAGDLRGHYGEQNGDLMRDPEMIFEAEESNEQLNLVPYYWRNDYAGVEQYSAFIEEDEPS